MNLYPWDLILAAANEKIADGADVYQQFNCAWCGTKQTMITPNVFHATGICEVCKLITNIKKDGMNYMLHYRIGMKK